MNVVLPEKPKILNRRNVTYLTIFVLCTVAIAIAIYQFFSEEKLGVILGITQVENEQIIELRDNFNNLYTNELKINQKNLNIKVEKDDEEKDLVYTSYQNEEKSINNYELNINIPYINIKNDIIKNYNEDIKNRFENPAKDIILTTDKNYIYNVNYMSCIENDILSISILSTFKEGSGVQRTISKTYNYNLKTNKEVTLNDFLKIKNLDKRKLQEEIRAEIKRTQEQSEQLNQLGYNIFKRDITSEIYNVENIDNCFIYEGYLYIIYAYGNTNDTSEIDIVIL